MLARRSWLVAMLCGFVALSPAVSMGQDEEDEEAIFEGWEEEAKKEKEKEKTEPEVREKAAPERTEPSTSPRVGLGARAPGGHKGLLPSVHHEYGSLVLMGIFQTLLNGVFVLDDDEQSEEIGFALQRARIMLQGHVLTKDLEYFFQGEALQWASFALDMYLSYRFGDSGLSLKVGRFLPDFSYMLPRSEADLAAVEYPLYLTKGRFGVWRQLGFEVAYEANQALTLKLGVFNGLLFEPNGTDPRLMHNEMADIDVGGFTYSNVRDNNKAKDFLLRAGYRVSDSLSIDLNFWLGMPENANDASENDIVIQGGPGVEYNDGKLHLVTEFMFRVVSYGDPTDSVTSLGLWAHAGYRMSDLLEGIFRIDWIEPNLDADNDMRLRITLGPHLWIEQMHFRILVNLFAEFGLQGDPKSEEEIIGLLIQAAVLW